jgi:L-seryl-tRNA(Ser) seleniumtransferase
MNRTALRGIPAVDRILRALGDTGLPAAIVVDSVRRELVALRKGTKIPQFDELISLMRIVLRKLSASRIQPVINGTGIVIHTNFGRAPLGTSVVEALCTIGQNYTNLEYGLTDGTRGGRAAYLERSLAVICGAEAATVVNNNAAALILILRHFCRAGRSETNRRSRDSNREVTLKNEVVISRGELIQIGGGFRIPEILETSGARLREVGTTNKTSLSDYARAITRETSLILKVHRSNFYMSGFVESPRTEDIVELARKKRVPLVEDLGSGAIIETENDSGLAHETTPAELIRSGVPLVCFSGDKLLGGPQAGIIAGKARYVEGLKRDPFFRALRCDKLILSALEATVDVYLCAAEFPSSTRGSDGNGTQSKQTIDVAGDVPVMSMLHATNEELRLRAHKIVSGLDNASIMVSVGTGRSQVGGGTLPRSSMESVTLDIAHNQWKPQEIAGRLREQIPPVIGYISRDTFKLDLRTIFPRQDTEVLRALQTLSS